MEEKKKKWAEKCLEQINSKENHTFDYIMSIIIMNLDVHYQNDIASIRAMVDIGETQMSTMGIAIYHDGRNIDHGIILSKNGSKIGIIPGQKIYWESSDGTYLDRYSHQTIESSEHGEIIAEVLAELFA